MQEVYTHKAEELEAAGKLRDAEKMYCTIKQYDAAIDLYKRRSMWSDVIRVVTQHQKVWYISVLRSVKRNAAFCV